MEKRGQPVPFGRVQQAIPIHPPLHKPHEPVLHLRPEVEPGAEKQEIFFGWDELGYDLKSSTMARQTAGRYENPDG